MQIDTTPITPNWKRQDRCDAAAIAEAKQRIRDGYYDREHVTDRVVEEVEPLVLTGQGSYAEGMDGNAFAGLMLGLGITAVVAGAVGAVVWAVG